MARAGRTGHESPELDPGTAYELLTSIAALAEDRWRSVLTDGERLRAAALAGPGARWIRRVAVPGRFGWLNLLSLVVAMPPPRTAEHALDELAATDPETMHLVALGMRRRQLRALVADDTARAAIHGDAAARREVAAAAGSEETVVAVTRWLLSTESRLVQSTMVDLLRSWHATVAPQWRRDTLPSLLAEEVARRGEALEDASPVEVIREVSGGLVYAPDTAAGRTVLAPAPSVDPAVVVVDDEAADVVVYSPRASRPPSARQRVLLMSRALGDDTRLRLLEVLRDGRSTATALARRLATPRTTLIHHLALLRSAGLIRTEVVGTATYYALRADAPDSLGSALTVFYADADVSRIVDT